MRHLGSLLLSLLLAPPIWALTGIGIAEYSHAREFVGFGPDTHQLTGAAAMVGAGVAYALLVLPRLSPLGPALAGLAFVGATGWAAFDYASFDYASFSWTVPGRFVVEPALSEPANGIALLLAVPLLATVFTPRRWRRHERVAMVYAPPQAMGAGPYAPPEPYAPPPDPYAAPAAPSHGYAPQTGAPTPPVHHVAPEPPTVPLGPPPADPDATRHL